MAHKAKMCGLLAEFEHPSLVVEAIHRIRTDPGRLTESWYREIVESAARLQDALGRPVRYFAFPYGRRECLNPAAIQMTHDAGFEAVVSAYGGRNWPGGDDFLLARLPVDGPLIRLKNWVTGYPRRRYEPYEYTLKEKMALTEGALVS